MVWLDEEEIEIAAASGMGMSWTPTIMMACQSYAKLDKLLASGLPISFGTDCFSMDVLEELRYALYSANYVLGGNHFRLTSHDLVRRATLGGAECLGLADEIGTIEEGKKADLVVLSMRDAQLVPNTNYLETIAYRAKSRDVTHTIVDGRVVYADGRLQLVDQDNLFDEARRGAREWVRRSRDVLEATGVSSRIQPHFFADEGEGRSTTTRTATVS
jgi:cytosine/adenosine deaminase-related metal-dependent hydrolase